MGVPPKKQEGEEEPRVLHPEHHVVCDVQSLP